MLQGVIFEDAEKIILPSIRAILSKHGYHAARVATQRAPDGFNGSEVILRADGGDIIQRIVKEQDIAITIYCNHPMSSERYAEANDLLRILEGEVQSIPSINSGVKSVYRVSSTPIATDSPVECRYILFTILQQGSNILV